MHRRSIVRRCGPLLMLVATVASSCGSTPASPTTEAERLAAAHTLAETVRSALADNYEGDELDRRLDRFGFGEPAAQRVLEGADMTCAALDAGNEISLTGLDSEAQEKVAAVLVEGSVAAFCPEYEDALG